MEDRPHYYSDDHLWCILAAVGYIKETGDLDFLDQVVPFYEKDKQGNPLERGTVMEHLRRGLDFTRNDTGRHGLPLLGFADWNDTVNMPQGAEAPGAPPFQGWGTDRTIRTSFLQHIPGMTRRYPRFHP